MKTIDKYRSFGARLFPVAPCRIGDSSSKIPTIKGWQNTRFDEYTDQELQDYLDKGYGIGWALDPGWLIVDVDVHGAKQGNESLAILESEFDLTPSLTVTAKAGGRHIYYYKPQHIEIQKTVSDQFPDIDFLSVGCYVMIAGSPHWQGGEYRFENPEQPVHAIPDQILDAVKKRKPKTTIDYQNLEESVETIKFLLDGLDPVGSGWRKIAMACHHATGGSPEALQVFLDWSTSDPEYNDYGPMVIQRWESFGDQSEDPITLATLLDICQNENFDHFKRYTVRRDFGTTPFVDDEPTKEPRVRIKYQRLEDLVAENPKEREPVIDQLLREGEVGNFVAATKVGKSWLALGMAHSVAWGFPWLDSFDTSPGDVLYVDNELHATTIASRARRIRTAYQEHQSNDHGVYVEPVRGRNWDLEDLRKYFRRLTEDEGKQRFKLIILDALYRFMPKGNDENSNGAAKDIMNTLDAIAMNTDSAIMAVMHAPKGDISGRDVRDLHSGAGSFARAADLQVGVRQHEEDDHFVVEVINRSFAPVDALTVRKDFPIYTATELEPAVRLRKTGHEVRQERMDTDGVDKVVEIVTDVGVPITRTQIEKRWGQRVNIDRLKRLIMFAIDEERIEVSHTAIPERSNKETEFYVVKEEADIDVDLLF